MSSKKETSLKNLFTPAVTVIIIFGVISMLGDIVYESARSANSQYLNLLGFSAAKAGLIFGISEFLGYALRLFAGVMSDKSGKHWLFMFIGYGMLISVPLMGLTMNWSLLVILMLTERTLKSADIPYCVSNNAGNYLCNHVYYSGLDYIKQHKLHTKILFIHVPSINDFINIDLFKAWMNEYLEGLK